MINRRILNILGDILMKMIAITNARVYDGNGALYSNGIVLVEDGKIKSVGEDVAVPSGVEELDAKGKIVTPGLIDVHTHLGVSEAGVGREGADFNEVSAAMTPEIRALDGINPMERGFEDARQSGVTTVQVMPGSANVVGGEMVVMKTVGHIVDEMVISSPSGMKAATGENPKRAHGGKGKMPTTRMGVAAELRRKLIEAQNYIDGKGKNGRDLGLENMAKVLKKEMPLRVHAHRADDILTVLRIKEEFDILLTIEHCTEGHHIADYVAKHDVRVSFGPTMSTRSKVELADKGWHTIKTLLDAGVPCSITTDHPVVGIEYLITSAIHAIQQGGISEEQALRAITLDAAKHIGVDDRVGSIEAGKDADLVLWSGNPFELQSKVERVFIDGKEVVGG